MRKEEFLDESTQLDVSFTSETSSDFEIRSISIQSRPFMRLETDYIENYMQDSQYGFESLYSFEKTFWMLALSSTLNFAVGYTSIITSIHELKNLFISDGGEVNLSLVIYPLVAATLLMPLIGRIADKQGGRVNAMAAMSLMTFFGHIQII